jgi:sulfur-oxidizing protein SoxZ
MSEALSRVRVPPKAAKGEVIEIRAVITHPMESGQRVNETGQRVPRKIINRFVCSYNGVEVFVADWFPSITANPYLSFHTVATESGTLSFAWVDDDGTVYTATAPIEVV